MAAQPYTVTQKTLTANRQEEIRGETRFIALISASVDATAVEISIMDGGFQPLVYGVAVVELAKVDRIAIRSTVGQVVKLATGSAMVYDSRVMSGGTISMSITDVGGAGLGQEAMAASIPVVIASNQSAVPVAGSVADGAAVAGNPVLVAGQDGTNVQTLKTDTLGRPEVVGPTAAGSAIGTTAPVLVGGSDGTNVQRIKTDTSGNQVAVGAVADGSAVGTTAPLMVGASDGTNVKRVSAIADNATLPTSGNLTSVAGYYSSSARTLTSGRAGFLTVDRGGKQFAVPGATLDPVLAGYTASTLDAAASTNATSLKATAGMVYEVSAVNQAAYDVFIRLYNKASAPTVGTDVAFRVIRVPAGQTVTVTYPGGAYFATGIAYATTKLGTKADATVLVASDVQLTIQWG